jgi:hypothetical protein
MVMPPANQRAPDKSVDTAIKSRVIEVIYRFRVQATGGQPLQGVPVRFAATGWLSARPSGGLPDPAAILTANLCHWLCRRLRNRHATPGMP